MAHLKTIAPAWVWYTTTTYRCYDSLFLPYHVVLSNSITDRLANIWMLYDSFGFKRSNCS